MARETIFMVQGFSAKGVASPASRCKSQEGALREARRLSETMAGAVAFSSSGDPDLGDYDEEPVILSVFGAVPEGFPG
jgi:hypothetical protein